MERAEQFRLILVNSYHSPLVCYHISESRYRKIIQPTLLYVLCSKCTYTSCTRLPCIPDESDSQIRPTNAWLLHYIQVGRGADRFLDERARRTNGVRTQHVNGNILSESQTWSSTVDPLDQDTLLHDPRTPQPARMWATADFVPAHLQSAIPFWRDVILPATTEADRDTPRGWMRGVSVYGFVDSRAQGTRHVPRTPVQGSRSHFSSPTESRPRRTLLMGYHGG